MTLIDFWFWLIGLLWIGYFFLEGFDFGVGMLMPILGRDEIRRRVLINSIGPVWDANEVWFLTAGGATFAAFPIWYATMFSGFYLPLLIILVALILRAVGFEFRGKTSKLHGDTWRSRWDACIMFGSYVPAILWGVAFANIVRGVHLDANYDYAGTVLDLLNPYALLGGVTFAAVFLLHGTIYVSLKTVGDIRAEATALALKIGIGTLVVALAFAIWTVSLRSSFGALVFMGGLVFGIVIALLLIRLHQDGWAFTANGVAIAAMITGIFWALYPNVLPDLDGVNDLTQQIAASSPYTLKVMTWVAVVFTPIVVGYQAWTYWVFRKRIGTQHIPTPALAH